MTALPATSQDFARWRSRQRFTTAAQIAAARDVQYWLEQIEQGETPERVAGLREALARFERAMKPEAA
jgi:hypothetical protein